MKTPAYYIEKFIGLAIGICGILFAYKYWGFFSFLCKPNFFDKVITISTTLFGFLLTVLTLIVQSSSPIIQAMKQYGSYKRLILYNKSIVLLSAVICIISLVLNSAAEMMIVNHPVSLKTFAMINYGLFLWAIVDTFIFVIIFYRILISETKS
ncbi:MAG: hypothetical protein NTW29_06255 [Bacteroidetes bacterium]|nr:hypothetical protein [Bacteroidota bacterium]